MVKRKTRRPSFRARWRRYRKRQKKTIPIAPIAGFGGGAIFGTPSSGWSSPLDYAQNGDIDNAVRAGIGNVSGIVFHHDQPPSINFMGLINPLDFGTAPALKGLFWGFVAHKIANVLGQGKVFNRLPSPLNKVRV